MTRSRHSVEERLAALDGLQRERARIDAAEVRLLASLAADPTDDAALRDITLSKRYICEEVSALLRVSPDTGRARVDLAEKLVQELPSTLAMVESGDLPLFFARALATETVGLPAAAMAKVEKRALEKADEQAYGAFTRTVKRAVLAADPRRADEKFQSAHDQRRVCRNPDVPGMSWLNIYLPDHAAQALWNRIDHAARAAKRAQSDDERTMDQRRADAAGWIGLTGSLAGFATDDGGEAATDTAEPAGDASDYTCGAEPIRRTPTTTGPVEVRVVVAQSALAGFDDQPGEIDGIGAIPAALARQIAFDETSVWRRLVTDPVGRLIDYGTTVYRPPASLDRHVRARDKHCCFPGCFRRAVTTELDHVRPWQDGGPTRAANLQPLCGRHHHLKHEAGWTVHVEGDGTTTWISPTGLRRTVEAETYPIDTTAVQELRERHRRFVCGDAPVTVDMRWLRDAA